MQWVSAFIDSISLALGRDREARSANGTETRSGTAAHATADAARAALLALLEPHESWQADLLRQRIGMARSAAHLWFLRADVAQLLCPALGERRAHDTVMALTPLWGDQIPPGHLEAQRRHRSLSGR